MSIFVQTLTLCALTCSPSRSTRKAMIASPIRSLGGAITCMTFFCCSAAFAESEKRQQWVQFRFDKDHHVSTNITKNLSFGAKIELSTERFDNLGLNDEENEHEEETELEARFGMLYDAGGAVRSYLEFRISAEHQSKGGSHSTEQKVLVNEAYVSLFGQNRNQALSFGRWSVSDEREWLFDEELDGIHYFWRNEKVAFELMYAREQLFQKDLLGKHDDNEPDQLYARAFANFPGKNVGSVYGLFQKGQETDDADLLWFGASLNGSLDGDIDYWVDFAHVRGTEKERNVRGYGLDLGFVKEFSQLASNPRLIAGLAFGSGDDGEGRDSAFRQTGIQGNSAKFGGRTSYKYYGEVFDPELSNLAVLTIGTGFEIFRKSSIDIVYHSFVQHRASKKIRDSNLDRKPSGRSRFLGQEIDVILGIREFDTVDLDIYGGVFFPGAAFAPSRDPVVRLGFELSSEF